MSILPIFTAFVLLLCVISGASFTRAVLVTQQIHLSKQAVDLSWFCYKALHLENGQNDSFYFRDKWTGSPTSRLNLFPLLQHNAPTHPLFTLALSYLTTLYKPILEEKTGPKQIKKILLLLLDMERKALATKKDPPSLSDITFTNPLDAELYSKMIKGTSPYHLHPLSGVPPLSTIITFDPTQKKAIYWNYAPLPLLSSLFSPDIAQAILEKEQELIIHPKTKKKKMRNRPLSSSELQSILLQHNASIDTQLSSLIGETTLTETHPPLNSYINLYLEKGDFSS